MVECTVGERRLVWFTARQAHEVHFVAGPYVCTLRNGTRQRCSTHFSSMHVCWEGCALCSFALGRYRFRAAYERMVDCMYVRIEVICFIVCMHAFVASTIHLLHNNSTPSYLAVCLQLCPTGSAAAYSRLALSFCAHVRRDDPGLAGRFTTEGRQ